MENRAKIIYKIIGVLLKFEIILYTFMTSDHPLAVKGLFFGAQHSRDQ